MTAEDGARRSHRLLGYLRPYRGARTWGVAMVVVTNVAFLGVPELTHHAIDAIGVESSTTIAVLVVLLIAFATATAVSRILSRILIFNAGRAAEYDLRSDLFGHLMTLSPSYFRAHPTGDVMSRLTNDVQAVRAMWGPGLFNLANAMVAFVAVLVAMVLHDPIVTLWVIAPFPLIYIVGQAMSRRLYKTMRAVQVELGRLSARLQEDLGAIQVIKTYGLEDLRRVAFITQSQKLLHENMEAAKVRIQLGPTLNTLAALGTGILILFGGRAMIQGDLSKGEIVAMSVYIARLVWPTLTLGFTLAIVQRGRASWTRLLAILQERPEISDGAGAPLANRDVPAHVEVKQLTVTLGSRIVLDSVSFALLPSTVTAIVGRTGSGKSTLVDALCRVVPVPAGTVFFDGRDVTTLPLESVRTQIGYAPQDAFLFSTTIADNIAMGCGGGTTIPAARVSLSDLSRGSLDPMDPSRVATAARSAGLSRDLARMPEGLATIVGERGITLSGGQRQRVALARALVAMPRLLVLDDSLSSVDAETERLILGSLRSTIHGRTAVMISHRIAAIKDADQILVLEQGKLVARGTHDELLAAGGLYHQLYRSQLDTALARSKEVAS